MSAHAQEHTLSIPKDTSKVLERCGQGTKFIGNKSCRAKINCPDIMSIIRHENLMASFMIEIFSIQLGFQLLRN